MIIQELEQRPCRCGDLARRLPGISSKLLAERLRKLQPGGVVERRAGGGGGGEGVVYAATDRGLALEDALDALRR